jgi:predicted dehydrogenase
VPPRFHAGIVTAILVVIAVRVPQHCELVTTAIEAGKAVLCEWPLGRTLAEARYMAMLARDRNVLTTVGLQARSSPVVRYMADLVAGGYIGDVLSTTLTGFGSSWGAQIQRASDRYLRDADSGASMLTIPFGHAIDAVAFVLGEPSVLTAQLATRMPRSPGRKGWPLRS